jgi:hypothetical protein
VRISHTAKIEYVECWIAGGWRQLPSLATIYNGENSLSTSGLSDFGADVFRGEICVVGGEEPTSFHSSTLSCLNKTTGWARLSANPRPVGAKWLAASTFQDRFCASGGRTASFQTVDQLDCFNGSTWVRTTMPRERHYHASIVWNGTLCLAGGTSENNGPGDYFLEVDCWDGEVWSQLAPLPGGVISPQLVLAPVTQDPQVITLIILVT